MPRMKADPAGIPDQDRQGAKPGDGGLLPAAKVAPHIQAIRGVPRTTLHSPPNHQGLYSIEESVQKMHLSLNAAFGFRVPVAISARPRQRPYRSTTTCSAIRTKSAAGSLSTAFRAAPARRMRFRSIIRGIRWFPNCVTATSPPCGRGCRGRSRCGRAAASA